MIGCLRQFLCVKNQAILKSPKVQLEKFCFMRPKIQMGCGFIRVLQRYWIVKKMVKCDMAFIWKRITQEVLIGLTPQEKKI